MSGGVRTEDLWVRGDDGRLYAKRWAVDGGDARERSPIVLLHDSLGCVELWREFPEALAMATGRSVVAYDRLGFGKSDPHPGTLAPTFVRDEAGGGFRALRAQLGLERFVAFGHSVGGGMALAVAARFPERCERVITESAQAFVEDRTAAGIRDAKRTFADPAQVDRLKKYHGEKAAWVLSAWTETWLSPAFAEWNVDDDARRAPCPILVMHGEHDEYGSRRHPERIAALAAGPATMRILAGAGHVPHREMRAVVLDLVVGWLNQTF